MSMGKKSESKNAWIGLSEAITPSEQFEAAAPQPEYRAGPGATPDQMKMELSAHMRGDMPAAYQKPSGPSTVFDDPRALAIAESKQRAMQRAAATRSAMYDEAARAQEQAAAQADAANGYRTYKPGG